MFLNLSTFLALGLFYASLPPRSKQQTHHLCLFFFHFLKIHFNFICSTYISTNTNLSIIAYSFSRFLRFRITFSLCYKFYILFTEIVQISRYILTRVFTNISSSSANHIYLFTCLRKLNLVEFVP